MTSFQNIEEFISYRKNCILCGGRLVPKLCQATRSGSGNLLKINSKYKKETFTFKIKNKDHSKSDMLGTINCITNEIKYRYEDSDDFIEDFVVQSLIGTIINQSFLHVELSCDNKLCIDNDVKHNYYISTSSLVIGVDKVLPTELSWESFNINSSWVQNDWTENKTKIYSTDNCEALPVIIDLIHFDSMPKEKLFKKIKTIVTFS